MHFGCRTIERGIRKVSEELKAKERGYGGKRDLAWLSPWFQQYADTGGKLWKLPDNHSKDSMVRLHCTVGAVTMV